MCCLVTAATCLKDLLACYLNVKSLLFLREHLFHFSLYLYKTLDKVKPMSWPFVLHFWFPAVLKWILLINVKVIHSGDFFNLITQLSTMHVHIHVQNGLVSVRCGCRLVSSACPKECKVLLSQVCLYLHTCTWMNSTQNILATCHLLSIGSYRLQCCSPAQPVYILLNIFCQAKSFCSASCQIRFVFFCFVALVVAAVKGFMKEM